MFRIASTYIAPAHRSGAILDRRASAPTTPSTNANANASTDIDAVSHRPLRNAGE